MEKDLSEEIQIPGFTSLDDLPHLSNRDHLERSKSVGERAYIRHIERTQEELEDLVEYDLDSDDEEWLQNRASKVGLQILIISHVYFSLRSCPAPSTYKATITRSSH